MLKIKSNTNEFTIIFFEKIRRKINVEKLSVQPSLFLPLFSSLVSAPSTSSFLSIFWSAAPFSFLLGVLRFIFQPKILFFQPKRFLAFKPKRFTAPKHFFSVQNVFALAQNIFQFSHSSLLLFSALFFSGSALFLFQPFCFQRPLFLFLFSSFL